jgi:hypothetical protein
VKRVLLVLTVALVMAVMALAMALPAFAQANPCETGDTPSSPPDAGGAPSSPPSTVPPGFGVREDKERPGTSASPFTGPTDRGSCAH